MYVRTRFAPSPTGLLHVGGVRTALYAYLYAKRHQGTFVLRIEDTDETRSTKASVDAILAGMAWLGLDADEGPFYQRDRYDRYHEVAATLLAEGLAYRCSCSKERLEALRATQLENKEKPRYDGHCRETSCDPTVPHVIRFKTPQTGTVTFTDAVYGSLSVSNSELDDLIIIRSDNAPTYNFAVVIDDWDMHITHVIRGDDHINNTFRQWHLFEALKAPLPVFAHLPMILGEDGQRLSKRHGAVSVLEFREAGILPEALLNYLVRLGWSAGDQEIFSLDDMIAQFDLSHVQRGVAGFNYSKLYWLNQHYLKASPPEQTAAALRALVVNAGLNTEAVDLAALVTLQADRCKTLMDMIDKSRYFFEEPQPADDAIFRQHIPATLQEPLTALLAELQVLEQWDKSSLHAAIHNVCATFNLNLSKIGPALRVALTGGTQSPSLDATMALIGKARTVSRLESALARMSEA